MKIFMAAAVGLAASAIASPSLPSDSGPPSAEATTEITTACQNCHGMKGDSVSPTFPRLNGQQADYVAAQLKNFRDHKRTDPHARAYMWGMASALDDKIIADIAHYYASQTPTPPQSGGALAAEGKKIYMEGVPAQNIPPCQACHGDHGEGNGQFPRLAGQHAQYLTLQLESFRSLLRENEIMHSNTKDMTDSQIEAIVSYLAND
jgi:cytochrome c553